MSGETPSVRVKGLGNSLWVTIAPDAPIEAVQSELEKTFEPLKHMAQVVRVVLNAGDDKNGGRYHQFRSYLEKTFGLKEIVSPGEYAASQEASRTTAPPAPTVVVRHKETETRKNNSTFRSTSDTVLMAGRIRSGQRITAKKHLIIMGDVNPGCELVAGGDILIIGSLQGIAAAGQPNNPDAIILSLDFRPTQVKIAGLVAAGLPQGSQGRFEFAHIENDVIVVDEYQAANPFRRMPWPIIR
ncbi:septum site-determining protein MinC [Desulfosarcina sp. OttesenSCG-928-A07]|nr:septum site-determining protein MinC [Desulfosarcina sp. OttesenSCG-928-G17]MDL2328263.1 septum site-determining protein MinC [Desulfosarcina sp. OttesenSCG-928-A07]